MSNAQETHTHTHEIAKAFHGQMLEENGQIQNASLYFCKLHVPKEEGQTRLFFSYTRAP